MLIKMGFSGIIYLSEKARKSLNKIRLSTLSTGLIIIVNKNKKNKLN